MTDGGVSATGALCGRTGPQRSPRSDIIDLALDLAKECASSYRKAKPEVRKMWNRAFFRTISVRDGSVADFTYEGPFASLLGSHNSSMVVLTIGTRNTPP